MESKETTMQLAESGARRFIRFYFSSAQSPQIFHTQALPTHSHGNPPRNGAACNFEQISAADARIKGNAELVERLKAASIEELHPPLDLVSEFENQHVRMDVFATMRELRENIDYLVDDLKLSACKSFHSMGGMK
jgi:hypothetical protein